MKLKTIFEKLSKYIKNKEYRFGVNASLGFYNIMDDEKYLKRMYKSSMGRDLNLINPKTYNEKLQWLKLNDRNPLYTSFVDKYEVKNYIGNKIGKDYIIPTFGIWDTFDEIDFEKLPNQFVLKCTHDSGGVIICKNKATFDKKAAKKKINYLLRKNYYYHFREWPYKNVKPRIIAEQYIIDSSSKELNDYKFYTFNGKVKSILIATDRQNNTSETKFDFYDEKFNHLPFTRGHLNSDTPPQKPNCLQEMIIIAEKLSKDIPHVRVDFYEVDGRVYFGEMTFYPASGMTPFEPEEWDEIFGSWIDLSTVTKKPL